MCSGANSRISRLDPDRSDREIDLSSLSLRRRADAVRLRHFATMATALLSEPAASAPRAATSSGWTALAARRRCSAMSCTEAGINMFPFMVGSPHCCPTPALEDGWR